ncbi:MAG: outer membrane protein assembly factor BamA, partial [Desulfobacterales bacterium]|nr:outer membrane protein assembly factor BamA [Desulfobacterales bacterium]
MKQITIGFGLAIILFFSCITTLPAQDQVSVAVFPFEVQAASPNHQIQSVLPQMLKEKLEKEGAKVVLADTTLDVSGWEYPDFRREGIRLGVDWIILGHVFMSGQRMSVDSEMYSVYEDRPPLTFFSQAPNMGGLFGAVSSLGKGIIGELFQKQIIANIRISGNKRIESDAISRVIQTQTGELLDPESLTKDLRLIYKMG